MRMSRKIKAIVLFLLVVLTADAQEQRPWEVLLGELSTQEDVESAEWEDTYEMLCDLEQHPLDINTATREQLLQFPFLTEQQVEDLQVYIYYYGGMKTLGELAMVTSIDYHTRSLLTHFVYCGEQKPRTTPRWSDVLKYGHHDVVADFNLPFYERQGDKKGYLGYPYRHTVRYNFSYSDRLRIGLLGAQDAGEPFFANKNSMGYDYYSFFAEAHRLGKVKNLVVGRYRTSFGMGLVMGNSFSTGKMSVLSSLGYKADGLRAHTARTPGNYLQGAAATVEVAHGLELTAFASYRKVDATLGKTDSIDTSTPISSIVTDGYHRTATEMAKKNNSSETTAGGHVAYRTKGFRIGATVVNTTYDKALAPDTSVTYRRYYAMGKNHWNVSTDYGYTGHLFSFHGEAATGGCGAIATTNALAFTPSSQLSLMALYRFYGKKYNAIRANGFSEGGRVQNESGVYVGVKWQATRQLQLMAYTDYAYFPWAKYQASVSSDAWDNLVQVRYATDKVSLTARYRVKMRGYDNTEQTAMLTKTTHRARLNGTVNAGNWRMGANMDLAFCDFEQQSMGWMASGSAGYTHHWLRLTGNIGYFHTDDYDSRVYAYEQGVMYAYSYLSFEGEGLRCSVSPRASLGSGLTLVAHLSTTKYFDRDHISSSYQQIDHSSKTDLALQLRWRF